jgi:hypothetical protein
MAAYARQQPIQTPTNSIGNRAMYTNQLPSATDSNQSQQPIPTITRVTPNEGPSAGGTEVAVFGENLVMGLQVAFGDQYAPTQFVSSTSIITIAPPGRAGSVNLALVPPPGTAPYPASSNRPIYRYTAYNEEMMVMALKFLSEQQYGSTDAWQTFAQQSATSFVQSRVNRAGLQQQQQGFSGGHRMAADPTEIEEMLLKILNKADMSESPRAPNYDLRSASGATMLSLACCLGMHKAAAALLARGASADARDNGGYTPLMHAALHGRTKIFQLLVARGADASVRSLTGHSALGMAPEHIRGELKAIVLSTHRRRHSRPNLQKGLSFESLPSEASWDIASASYYESEVDATSEHPSCPVSRRPSAQIAASPLFPTISTPRPNSEAPDSVCSQMLAWRDTLATQINHFQETVNKNIPNFQLPPLPQLPDYRRLSSLVPTNKSSLPATDVAKMPSPAQQHVQPLQIFRASIPQASPPPPAYHELFPEKKPADVQNKTPRMAEVGAVADQKCAMTFGRDLAKPYLAAAASDIDVGSLQVKVMMVGGMPVLWLLVSLCALLITRNDT